MDFDKVLDRVGGLGWYQRVLFCALFVVTAVGTVPGFVALVFHTYVPQYRCFVPGCDVASSSSSMSPSASDRYQQRFVSFSVPPAQSGHHSSISVAKCLRYWRHNLTDGICQPSEFDRNTTVHCTEFVYDRSVFVSSFVTQWSLTCRYQSLVELPSTLYFVGVLMGSLIYGTASDKFGRKMALLLAMLQMIAACAVKMALFSSFLAVCGSSVLLGMSSCGVFQTSLVLLIEMVGGQWRVLCASLFNLATTAGVLASLVLGYCRRDWLSLNVISGAPLILLLPIVWLVPESVRWLLSQGRADEARDLVVKMASRNGQHAPDLLLPPITSQSATAQQHAQPDKTDTLLQTASCNSATEQQEKPVQDDSCLLSQSAGVEGSIIDCIKVPVMRRRLVCTLMGWFSVNLAFYGLVTDMQNIPGNFFINLLITSLAEVPGYLLSWALMDRLGRRLLFVISALTAGACIIAAALISNSWLTTNAVLLVLAKCGSCAAFSVVYVYTSELFPTQARTTAVGLCSTCGRVAATLAPQISNLAVYGQCVPLLVIGISSASAGMLVLMLPETRHRPLPESLQQALDLQTTSDVDERRWSHISSHHCPVQQDECDVVENIQHTST